MSDRDIIEGTAARMGWSTVGSSSDRSWVTYRRDGVTITVGWKLAERGRERGAVACQSEGATTIYARDLSEIYQWLRNPPANPRYDKTGDRLMSASGVLRFVGIESAFDEVRPTFLATPKPEPPPAPPIARSVARFRELEF